MNKQWFWNCIIGIITPYLVADRPDSARMGSNVFFLWGSLCCVSCKYPKKSLSFYIKNLLT